MEYKIINDVNEMVTCYVCDGLKCNYDWLKEHVTFGFAVDGKIAGGLIFHDYNKYSGEIWWTVYTNNKRWCNRRMLRTMFGLAFNALNCRRISIAVDTRNLPCLNFVKKLGFKQEGIMRAQRDDGGDNAVFGMLKTECKWL